MEKKSSTKKIVAAIVVLLAAIAIMSMVFNRNKPAVQEGTKAYTLSVVDDQGTEKKYSGKTDAEYLSNLMDELAAAGDFSYAGSESDYGLYIETVNGLTADYDADGAYWSIYVNGEYGQYGADAQPVADGDAFSLVYEIYDTEDAAQ